MCHYSSDDTIMILNALPKFGPIKIQKLIEYFHNDISKIFDSKFTPSLRTILSKEDIETLLQHKKFFDSNSENKKLSTLRGNFISILNDKYPGLLKQIPDAPVGLYSIGTLKERTKNIAIVGSRSNTIYGLKVARKLAMELSIRGFSIVSGMARGIDAAAHEGTIAANGHTIAVLGNGLDIIYPQEHSDLYRKITEHGAIISEFPLGRRPDKQTFPIRNRIIAGLCHAVIVVESDNHGGSMITARMAGEYGRHVFAVPGRIDDISSSGCLSLIKDGATMLTSIDDIFEELPYLDSTPQQTMLNFDDTQAHSSHDIACPVEKCVYETIRNNGTISTDNIIEISGIPTTKVLQALQMLEIRKLISKRYDGLFEITK